MPSIGIRTNLVRHGSKLKHLWEWLFDSESEVLYDSEGKRLSCLKE